MAPVAFKCAVLLRKFRDREGRDREKEREHKLEGKRRLLKEVVYITSSFTTEYISKGDF